MQRSGLALSGVDFLARVYGGTDSQVEGCVRILRDGEH